MLGSMSDVLSSPVFVPVLGAVSRKPRKLFGPAKPFLVICILKTEKCIGLKLCMKGTSDHIKNIMELTSSVVKRFDILLWLSGCENFSGPSRNGQRLTIELSVCKNFHVDFINYYLDGRKKENVWSL